jgi:hypothetical protein
LAKVGLRQKITSQKTKDIETKQASFCKINKIEVLQKKHIMMTPFM